MAARGGAGGPGSARPPRGEMEVRTPSVVRVRPMRESDVVAMRALLAHALTGEPQAPSDNASRSAGTAAGADPAAGAGASTAAAGAATATVPAGPAAAAAAHPCHPAIRRYVRRQLSGPLASWAAMEAAHSGAAGAMWVAEAELCGGSPPAAGEEGSRRDESGHSDGNGAVDGAAAGDGGGHVEVVGAVAARVVSADAVELQHLCVDPRCRRAGVGARLCDEVIRFATGRGATVVRLETLPQMGAAVALYGKLGFAQTAANTYGSGAKQFNLLRFERRLPPSSPPAEGAPAGARSGVECGSETGVRKPPAGVGRSCVGGKAGAADAAAAEPPCLWRTGSAVRLVHVASGLCGDFLVEVDKPGAAGTASVKLAPCDRPYERLYALQSGKVGFGGQHGRFATFGVVPWAPSKLDAAGLAGQPDVADICGNIECVSLRSLGNPTKVNAAGGVGWHLAIRGGETNGAATALGGGDLVSAASLMRCDGAHGERDSLFVAREAPPMPIALPPLGAEGSGGARAPSSIARSDGAPLSSVSATLERDGYAVCRRAVSPALVDRASIAVWRALGTPGAVVARGGKSGLGRLEGGVGANSGVLALATSAESGLASLLDAAGVGACEAVHGEARVDLCFPDDGDGKDRGIDVTRAEALALPASDAGCSPTLIAGVALTLASARREGNLEVFAGSHTDLDGRPVDVDLAEPLLLERGDVVLLDPRVVCRQSLNTSPAIQCMVYFAVQRRSRNAAAVERPRARVGPVQPLEFKPRVLTEAQIHAFVTDGVVVVPGVLDDDAVASAVRGMDATLCEHGIDPDNLAATAHRLSDLSSTSGAGGVLDVFYPDWKLRVTLANSKYRDAMADIVQATYGSASEGATGEDSGADSGLWSHPFGAFDAGRPLAHVDRIGFRAPEACVKASGGRKKDAVQRSLTPHLDCCPSALHAGGGKKFPRWRPIQCMIALTDTVNPNEGGFECVPGFHREFESYYSGSRGGGRAARDAPPVCVGDFTPIQPREDQSVIERFRHIPINAGSAVFWDQRLPHANAKANNSYTPRRVVYGGFLPRVPVNEAYAAEQLKRMRAGLPQPDFWMRDSDRAREAAPTAFLEANADAAMGLLT